MVSSPHISPRTAWISLGLMVAASLQHGSTHAAPPPNRTAQAAQATSPGRAAAAQPGHSAEDYRQHVQKLRRTLRGLRGRFRVVVQPPFVIAGDLSRGDMRRFARFIKRTSDELKRLYFARDPLQINTIYLFRGRASYRENTRRLINEVPDTPFGFYISQHRALIMNIRTGGGTLSHELVHPFMEANFPACPPWFNEGMGSLYEAVGFPRGRIRGFTNWRLPGLKRAIRARAVPSFAALMAQNETQFYSRDPGTNYSQSRYLVHYLQDRGLLPTFYHRFLRDRRTDPSGVKTLKSVLGTTDLARFKRAWQRWVLKLRWRGK